MDSADVSVIELACRGHVPGPHALDQLRFVHVVGCSGEGCTGIDSATVARVGALGTRAPEDRLRRVFRRPPQTNGLHAEPVAVILVARSGRRRPSSSGCLTCVSIASSPLQQP